MTVLYSSSFLLHQPAPPCTVTLSLPDALPIPGGEDPRLAEHLGRVGTEFPAGHRAHDPPEEPRREPEAIDGRRSEEHTSELQSRQYLVCRLLLEKKKNANDLERPTITQSMNLR